MLTWLAHSGNRRRLTGRRLSVWLCVLGVLFGLMATVPGGAAGLEPRSRAQDFSLLDTQDRRIVFSDYRDKVVLVNFWATWCPPCVAEFPSMQRLKTHFADKPFAILAINLGEDKTRVVDFAAQLTPRIDFTLLLDPTAQVATAWQVLGLPTSFLLDKKGRVAEVTVGAQEWFSPSSQHKIERLLAE